MDAWLSKWGSWAGGLILLALTAVGLPSRASSRAELLLGVGMASFACTSLMLFGVLARRVHLAWHRGAAPWRIRVGELLSIGAGVGIVVLGIGWMSRLGLSDAGMVIGGLLVLSLGISVGCLGLWSTLSRVAKGPLAAAGQQ